MEITAKEKNALEAYQGIGYRLVNNILEVDMSAEADFIRKETDKPVTFSREDIKSLIENVKLIYSAMLKYSQDRKGKPNRFFRGTSENDMKRITARQGINKFLSTTYDTSMASGYFSLTWDEPAFIGIDVEPDVPYLYMSDVLEDYGQNAEKEVLLAPFLKVKKLEHVRNETRQVTKGRTTQRVYKMEVSRQELTELDEENKKALTTAVLDSAESISKKQERYFKVISEIEETEYFIKRNEENIFNIKTTLSRPSISFQEKKELEDDLDFFENDRKKELEETLSRLTSERDGLKEEVQEWKRKVAQICMSECRVAEKEVEHQKAEEKEQQAKLEEQKQNEEIKETKDLHSHTCLAVKDKVSDIKSAVNEGNNFKERLAFDARAMGFRYTSYMEFLQRMPAYLSELNDKVQTFSEAKDLIEPKGEEDRERATLDRDKIKTTCEKLLNAVGSTHDIPLTELMHLEENSFKKGIDNKVSDIKLGIFLDILRNEVAGIDNVKGIKKLLYKVTGQEKKNQQRKAQLEQSIRQILIKKRELMESTKTCERQSVHKIMAEIKSLCMEYGNTPEFSRDVAELRKIEEYVGQIYKVDQERVNRTANNMAQTRLPAVKGQKYNKADMVMQEVSYLSQKRETTSFRIPTTDIEYDIQTMSNIIRNFSSREDRSRHLSMNMNR